MLDVVGYVVVEVNGDNTDDLYGLVPEFYWTPEDARSAAELFTKIARQTGKNKNVGYLASAVVALDGEREKMRREGYEHTV